MKTSPSDTGRVRDHFRKKAFSFDQLYDEEHALQRRFRSGLFNRREIALAVARDYDAPSVLDVGGGSGRIGELILEQGASRYVDVDLSDTMLDLARERLERFGDKVELVLGDFLETPLQGPFDVVLALGYFDYIEDAAAHTRRMGELCSGSAIASFPRWNWIKGPVRKVRYELINNCPIYDYTESGLRKLFTDAGFTGVELHQPSRGGYIVRADK